MIIEPQELKVDIVGNVNYTMAIYSLLLIYEKIILWKNRNVQQNKVLQKQKMENLTFYVDKTKKR